MCWRCGNRRSNGTCFRGARRPYGQSCLAIDSASAFLALGKDNQVEHDNQQEDYCTKNHAKLNAFFGVACQASQPNRRSTKVPTARHSTSSHK